MNIAFEKMTDILVGTVEETLEGTAGGDAALQEGSETSSGTVSGGDAFQEVPAGDTSVVYITAENAGTVEQLETISGQLSDFFEMEQETHAELLQAVRDQTDYIRDGNMLSGILLGFISGILLFGVLRRRR